MIIKSHKKSIFEVPSEVLVNPCNCVGVAGAGLSLEFKLNFPASHAAYVRACRLGYLRIGIILPILDTVWIYHFPTKDRWQDPSRLEYIEAGMRCLNKLEVGSISIPKLGCGLGGLNWNDVRPLILDNMSEYKGVINFFE